MRLPAAIKSKYCLSFTCYPPKSILGFHDLNKYFTAGTIVYSLIMYLKDLSPSEIGVI